MQGWKNNLLCHVERETLIKAVVQAIPSYVMVCFYRPKSFCEKLNAFIHNFWWKGDPGDRGIYWAKWDTTCLPKFQSEIDFGDFLSFNQAMLARQC